MCVCNSVCLSSQLVCLSNLLLLFYGDGVLSHSIEVYMEFSQIFCLFSPVVHFQTCFPWEYSLPCVPQCTYILMGHRFVMLSFFTHFQLRKESYIQAWWLPKDAPFRFSLALSTVYLATGELLPAKLTQTDEQGSLDQSTMRLRTQVGAYPLPSAWSSHRVNGIVSSPTNTKVLLTFLPVHCTSYLGS